MDIARPDLKRRQVQRRWAVLLVAAFCLTIAGFAVSRLKPAAPTVERGTVWTDTVKRGPMIRQVRGPGTLTPRKDRLRLIPAETEATVVRIRVLPGAKVTADTVLMELTDPQLQQELIDAQLQLRAAHVEYHNLQAKLQSDLMTQRAGAATVSADYQQAKKQSQTDKALFDLGVISGLTYGASQGKADEMTTRNDLTPAVRPSGNTIWTRKSDEQEQAHRSIDYRGAEAGRGGPQG